MPRTGTQNIKIFCRKMLPCRVLSFYRSASRVDTTNPPTGHKCVVCDRLFEAIEADIGVVAASRRTLDTTNAGHFETLDPLDESLEMANMDWPRAKPFGSPSGQPYHQLRSGPTLLIIPIPLHRTRLHQLDSRRQQFWRGALVRFKRPFRYERPCSRKKTRSQASLTLKEILNVEAHRGDWVLSEQISFSWMTSIRPAQH